MKILLKDKLKNISVKRWLYLFFLAVLILVLFLISTGSLLKKYKEKARKEALEKFETEMERPYMEDKYGGKTPEETFDLFLEALKNNDIELASKYFILEKQGEWRVKLQNVKEKKNLLRLISDLQKSKENNSLYNGNFQYIIKNNDSSLQYLINFVKYPNGIWKITEL